MQAQNEDQVVDGRSLKRKRRDMKACASCRRSKVKCDGNKPCTRCATGDIQCMYPDVYKDPTTERLESLEREVLSLKSQLKAIQSQTSATSPGSCKESWGPTTVRISTGAVGNPIAIPSIRGTRTTLPIQDESMSPESFSLGCSNFFHQLGQTPLELGWAAKKGWRAFQRQEKDLPHVVARGLVSEQQASNWFQSFFSGSHLLVPVFSLQYDNYASVAARSAFLFDAIITVGCRAEEGPSSGNYQKLQSTLRERTASFILNHTLDGSESLESIQALIVAASYSEHGWLLSSLALRLAMQLSLPTAVDGLLTNVSGRNKTMGDQIVVSDEEEQNLFRAARIWWGAFNLEHIFSLDGEKPPSVTFKDNPSRMRSLLSHPERTVVDLRLLSQVELNIIRARAHATLASCWTSSGLDIEEEINSTVRDACIDLDLWLNEWIAIVRDRSYEYPSRKDCSTAVLNLRIQHSWALITLHLKAVSYIGTENIAAMTGFQRDMVCAAKESAVRHLDLLLKASSSPPSPHLSSTPDSEHQAQVRSAYLASFKWTMDFVWAKCAFSILLVLRLAMLLRDPPHRLMKLLRDSYEVLEEIKNVSSGHIAYFHILQVSIDKCEKALQEWLSQQSDLGVNGTESTITANLAGLQERSAESEFEGYTPKEFLFEWNFPGLNIRHVPLGWQDLFVDFDFKL